MDDNGIGSILQTGSPDELRNELGRLDDEQLEQVAIDLQTLVRKVDTALAHAVGELDRRAVPDRRYALSTKQWLRRFCRQAAAEAAATVAAARGLPGMPNVAKRALEGEIPADGLRRLAGIQRRYPDDFPLHEEVFADAATYLDPRDLRRAIEHWRQQVDHAGALDETRDRVAHRSASIGRTIDGMWHLDAWLDPESGVTVATALRAHADPGNIDPGDLRSHGQRMADGLTEMARRFLDTGAAGSSGGDKPHVTVTVSYDQLTASRTRTHTRPGLPLPELDGVPVDPEAIRRLACDARIVRIVVDGEGQPLDVGRAVRTVTPAMRRALDVRDAGCVWNGCDVPIGWCDAHHIEHWADGGPTSLTNLQLLCRRHHGAVHEGGNPRTGRRGPPTIRRAAA